MRVKLLISICIATASAVGCADRAPPTVRVAGTVEIDGEPLDGGTIRFVPKSGRPASSEIIGDGSFDLSAESIDKVAQPGIPPGAYRVQVSYSEIVDDQTIHWKVPQHYADFRTSGLKVDVTGPTDDLVIELSSEPEQDVESAATREAPVEVLEAEAAKS